MIGASCPHDDAEIVVGDIVDFGVRRVLVDRENAANVLTWDTILGLKVFPEN